MARKKTDEEKAYHVLLENVREMYKHRFGRDVLWHILSFCDLYSDTYTGDRRSDYLSGKRGVGLFILQMLEDADRTAYPRLLLEMQKREENNDGGRNSTSNRDDGDSDSGDADGAAYDFGDDD